MPWLLGQVCRHWRAVALQTPSLWDSFVGGDSSQKVFHWPILEDVLSRSGNSPLEVSLVGLTPGSAGVLARHASRLRELQVTCSFDGLYAFEDAPEMSILTNLCLIASTTKTIYENSPVYFDIASKAPRLTHVFLNAAVTVHITLLRIVLLPWPQITHLELELGYNNYYKCILPILSQCQNLRPPGEYFLRGPTPPSIYVFPRLTFLAIRSSLTILSCMQCPALRTFALRGVLQCGEFIEKDWLDFRAFMDRSRCTLQEVRLIPEDNRYQPAIFSAPLEEFLTFVSHVPRLVIDHTRAPYTMGLPGTLDRVAGVPGVVAFPELQMLTLKAEATALLKLLPVWAGLTLQQDVEKVLIRSVESRWRVPEGAMRIKTVRIELAVMIRYDGIVDYEDPEDLDVKKLHAMLGHTELLRRMKIFKDEGLDVSVVVCEHWSRLATLPIKERRRTYL
ncbi:hypothetical protein BDZ89DRAFT_1080305 [Hymenopellis radicata]|nr:hypothetical protein BDZ89DRAFT_1080305 [Hymenopellis radicata]